jgi:hypothetical protein
MILRELRREEIDMTWTIDRSEVVHGVYQL